MMMWSRCVLSVDGQRVEGVGYQPIYMRQKEKDKRAGIMGIYRKRAKSVQKK